MVGCQRIPTVSEELVKSLGHWFDESLNNINQAKETSRTLQEGCHKIDGYLLQGKFMVWYIQHIFIWILLWLLLTYEIATS